MSEFMSDWYIVEYLNALGLHPRKDRNVLFHVIRRFLCDDGRTGELELSAEEASAVYRALKQAWRLDHIRKESKNTRCPYKYKRERLLPHAAAALLCSNYKRYWSENPDRAEVLQEYYGKIFPWTMQAKPDHARIGQYLAQFCSPKMPGTEYVAELIAFSCGAPPDTTTRTLMNATCRKLGCSNAIVTSAINRFTRESWAEGNAPVWHKLTGWKADEPPMAFDAVLLLSAGFSRFR